MATYTKVCSNNSSYTLRLELSESNVNVANNTSIITYSLYLDSTYPRFEDWNVTYTLYIGSEISINVTKNMSMPPTRKEPLLLTSGSKVVTHDSDGKKSLSVSCSVSTVTSQPYLPGSASISGQTFTLTTIARKSTLTTENGKVVAMIATATSIQVNRQNSAFTHTITYTFGSASSTIISKSNEISVTWTPPISLYSQMVGKSSEHGTITIETFNGATSLGSNSYPLLLEAYNSIVYQPPNISGLSFERGSGNSDDTWVANPNGGDLKVNFAAAITSGIPGNSTTFSVKLDSSVKYTKTDETSGDKIVYIPGIGTVTTHILTVSIKDTIGASSQWTLTVPTISVPFDINVDLPGAAFGKVAEHSKTLELANDWGLRIQGFPMVDYIVEQGTSDGWAYRKWSSGTAECWLLESKTITGSPGSIIGNAYYISTNLTDFPDIFSDTPRGYGSGRLGSGIGWLTCVPRGKRAITLFITGNANSTEAHVDSVMLTGRWK